MVSDRLQRQIERLLDEADQAITAEDWSTVSSRARSVLAIDPENSEGIAYLAAAKRALGTSGTFATSQLPSTPGTTASVAMAQPTSFANGRYQVKSFLGEGGKKKVYLAHDTLLDREVAFALIKTRDSTTPASAASNVKPRPWGGSALTNTSSPCSTWDRNETSPTWSPS